MIKGVGGVSMSQLYWFAFVLAAASVIIMRLILRSRLGLGLSSIRDNDRAAACCGIAVFKLKLYSFIISAFVTGLAGSVFYVYQQFIEPATAFNIKWTMIVILATVIGGMGIEEGPFVGTIIVVFLHFLLAKYAGVSLLIQGAILVIIMLIAPQGIMGYLRGTRAYRFVLRHATGNGLIKADIGN